ncbi:hypothetical protein SAFG77S_00891 [Streptomyces afghaniensis]
MVPSPSSLMTSLAAVRHRFGRRRRMMRQCRSGCRTTSAAARGGVLQTHTSVVFFVGDRAYKLKKPVDLGFLDYTTLASR